MYSQTKQRSKVKILEDRLLELERKLEQHTQASASPQPSVNVTARSDAEVDPGPEPNPSGHDSDDTAAQLLESVLPSPPVSSRSEQAIQS